MSSASFDSTEDQDWVLQLDVSSIVKLIENDPAIAAALEKLNRRTNLKNARRVGNTSGKWAQRQLPQAVLNQNPATKRVF